MTALSLTRAAATPPVVVLRALGLGDLLTAVPALRPWQTRSPATSQGPRWRADEHEVARWCRLLEESGIAADPRRLDIDLPPGPLPHGAREATLVHPGAASPARRWPAERFAAVARAEASAGR